MPNTFNSANPKADDKHTKQHEKQTTHFTISAKVDGVTKSLKFNVITIPKEMIHTHVKVSPYNPRNQTYLTIKSVEELRKDIEERGQLKPVWAHQKDGIYYILDGSCRLKVLTLLEKPIMAFVTNDDVSEAYLKSIAHSLSKSKSLSLMERGALYQEWLDTGFFKRTSHIAQAEGVSATLIGSAIQAHNLRPEFKACFLDPISLGRPAIMKLHSIQKELNKKLLPEQVAFYQELTTKIDCEEINHDMEMALFEAEKLKNPNAKYDKQRVVPSTLNKHIISMIKELYNNRFGTKKVTTTEEPIQLISIKGISGQSSFSQTKQSFTTNALNRESFDFVNDLLNSVIATQSQGGLSEALTHSDSELSESSQKLLQEKVEKAKAVYLNHLLLQEKGLLTE